LDGTSTFDSSEKATFDDGSSTDFAPIQA
jgi:hypothetical protein